MPAAVPSFYTSRLILQPPTLADAPAYERHFVDYEVISHLSAAVPWPYPRAGVAEYLGGFLIPQLGKDRWAWGIFRKSEPGELIGCIDYWRPGRPENRGFWLGRAFWGQGFMAEAVEATLDYAFRELGFDRLVFANAVGNARSRRIKERTGARLLRVEPSKFVNPAYAEHEVWELTRQEWSGRKR
jgi:[ribosomal protein S5]-alanine N-acetyltransferase